MGKLCFTNTPSNTAFRGFGGPQGAMMAEAIMDDIAQNLGLDPVQVNRDPARASCKISSYLIAKSGKACVRLEIKRRHRNMKF